MEGLSTLVQRVRHWSPVFLMPVAFHISSATRLGGKSAAGIETVAAGAAAAAAAQRTRERRRGRREVEGARMKAESGTTGLWIRRLG